MLGDIGVRAEGLLPHSTLKHIVKYRLLGGNADAAAGATEGGAGTEAGTTSAGGGAPTGGGGATVGTTTAHAPYFGAGAGGSGASMWDRDAPSPDLATQLSPM
jgi:hypothetical protein